MTEKPRIITPKQLRKRRQQLGFSQEQLARRLGVARGAVARWEIGTRAIPAMLSRALDDLEAEEEIQMQEQLAEIWTDEEGNIIVSWNDSDETSELDGENWYGATVTLDRKNRLWSWEAWCNGNETLEVGEDWFIGDEETRDIAKHKALQFLAFLGIRWSDV